jgi:hypothetical protein
MRGGGAAKDPTDNLPTIKALMEQDRVAVFTYKLSSQWFRTVIPYQWENRSRDTSDSRFAIKGTTKGQRELTLCRAWRHSMPKGPLLPSEFAPTKFSTSVDKANFGNTFLHFIESEWALTLFSKNFYNRLSMCFGHIAHYDRTTFYETWFTSDADRLRFLRHTLDWPCWGDPEFTFCDVERAIQREVRKRNYLARYELLTAEEVRSSEMETLRRLEVKYRAVERSHAHEAECTFPANGDPKTASNPRMPVQASLF